jgi:hypothetical protein
MNFTGDFETHITVETRNDQDIEALRLWSIERNLKFLHIVLDRGRFVSQPMVTRTGTGRLSDELAAAEETGRELGLGGFGVIRVKIEAAPWNEDVPQTADDVVGNAGNRYFEHHIKLALPASTNLSTLAALAELHSAHLSRNVRRNRNDGLDERFVTQRCRDVGRVEARERLDSLLDEIRSAGHQILEVEEEYVVYDSSLATDAGWISPGV